jgi:hypothetical protein
MKFRNEIKPPGDFIKMNHIGTPCGIIPYRLNQLGHWSSFVGGDGHFYKQIERFSEKKSVFLHFVMYIVEPTEKEASEQCLQSYSKKYKDIYELYGINKQALWFHWSVFGKKEGRRLCWCFCD